MGISCRTDVHTLYISSTRSDDEHSSTAFIVQRRGLTLYESLSYPLAPVAIDTYLYFYTWENKCFSDGFPGVTKIRLPSRPRTERTCCRSIFSTNVRSRWHLRKTTSVCNISKSLHVRKPSHIRFRGRLSRNTKLLYSWYYYIIVIRACILYMHVRF